VVEVIRLRGLYNSEPRWDKTLDMICRLWQSEKGLISPYTIITFLHAAGPGEAKALSDDGLLKLLFLIAIDHKNGDDSLQ
jgi:hypothetical protein